MTEEATRERRAEAGGTLAHRESGRAVCEQAHLRDKREGAKGKSRTGFLAGDQRKPATEAESAHTDEVLQRGQPADLPEAKQPTAHLTPCLKWVKKRAGLCKSRSRVWKQTCEALDRAFKV